MCFHKGEDKKFTDSGYWLVNYNLCKIAELKMNIELWNKFTTNLIYFSTNKSEQFILEIIDITDILSLFCVYMKTA